jgi:hypothetical protein
MKTMQNSKLTAQQIMDVMADISIDIQKDAENIYTITVGNMTMTAVTFENGYTLSTILDSGEVQTYEITFESRPKTDATPEDASKNPELVERVALINGTEIKIPTPKPVSEYPYDSSGTRGTTKYWWDGKYFVEGSGIPYPHPDKSYHGINPSNDWSSTGYDLVHNQINAATSDDLLYAGGHVLGLVIGCVITVAACTVAPTISAFGFEIGSIIGTLIGGYVETLTLDEDGCIWWWFNASLINWLVDMAPYFESWWFWDWAYAVAYLEWHLATASYFKVGSLWAIDCLGIGNPAPPPPPPTYYHAVSATSSYTGNGYVNNKDNILGAADANYAYLSSGSYGNKAEITATLSNTAISGTLYFRCYTPTSNGANLKIYVCNTAGVWTLVKETNLYPANTPMTVNCGYVSNIVKVSVVAYHEYNGYPSYIYADAVWVV